MIAPSISRSNFLRLQISLFSRMNSARASPLTHAFVSFQSRNVPCRRFSRFRLLASDPLRKLSVSSYTEEDQTTPQDARRSVIGMDSFNEQPAVSFDTGSNRKAVSYDKSLTSRLTPTLRSFTLDGKVAVVTG